jgi:protein MAK16
MTHIICRASFCLFWEDGVCSSEEIEYEPENGCMTFQDIGDLNLEEEAEDEWDDEDDDLFDEDEDDDWDDEDDDGEDDDWDDVDF